MTTTLKKTPQVRWLHEERGPAPPGVLLEPSPPLLAGLPRTINATFPQAESECLKRVRNPVLFMSGAKFSATGGGQRPAQLAREFARLGHPTYHWSIQEPTTYREDGVTVVSGARIGEFAERMRGSGGCAIVCLPTYLPQAQALKEAGFAIIYDALDAWKDWPCPDKDLKRQMEDGEVGLAELADACTATAPMLAEWAAALGFPEPLIIPNGGPNEPLSRTVPPADMKIGRCRVVYIGHLTGNWFDWDLLEELAKDDDLAITIVGDCAKLDDEREWPHLAWRFRKLREKVVFVGEKPWAEAMKYAGAAHVGMIPFCNRDVVAAVDAIKAYEYAAAGIWTVVTPEMESMEGRQGVLTSDRDDFAGSVKHAASLQGLGGGWMREGDSWSARARTLETVIEGVVRRVSSPRPEPREDLHAAGACNLRVSVAAPAQCNMHPRCPYCFNGNLAWTDPLWDRPMDEWLEGLLWLSEAHGPLWLSFCYGETCADRQSIALMGEVARSARVDIVTNLLAPEEDYMILPANGNARLCTSYHPHHWTYNIVPFLEKRARLEAGGLVMGPVMVVAWPPHMPHWRTWRKAIEARGWEWDLIPYRGEYQGQLYPNCYRTEDMRQVEDAVLTTKGRIDLMSEESRGRLCGAGSRYVFVRHDGVICSCAGMFAEQLGSLWDRKLDLYPADAPCPEQYCYCHDLWPFVEPAR